jgi:lipopolysaccharide export system protein LptA
MRGTYFGWMLVLGTLVTWLASPALAEDSPSPPANQSAAPQPAATTATTATASTPLPADQGISVEASNGITWDQVKHIYSAEGGVLVRTQGQTLAADRIVAHYDPKKSDQIGLLEAFGNVQLQRGDQKAMGNQGSFQLQEGTGRLSGGGLRVEQGEILITAQESLNFDQKQNKAVAVGGVVMTRGTSRLMSDKVEMFLRKQTSMDTAKAPNVAVASSQAPDKASEALAKSNSPVVPGEDSGLEKLIATGNVAILTATDVARGSRAIYDPVKQVAILEGKVSLTRDKTQLSGARAEVDMKNGISKLLPGTGGRVFGILGGGTIAPTKPTSNSSPGKP